MGLLDFLKKKDSHPEMLKSSIPSAKTPPITQNGAEIADQWEGLGYFKYADAPNLEQLKSEIGKGGVMLCRYSAPKYNSGRLLILANKRNF